MKEYLDSVNHDFTRIRQEGDILSEVKWIKIPLNVFELEKVKLVEDYPNADSVLIIWFKLLCKALRNNSYTITNFASDQYPLDKFLSVILHRDRLEIKDALEILKEIDAIEIVPEGIKVNRFWLTNREWRSTRQYKEWRSNVFERDNYTCQDCGVKGGYLEAHHIKSFAHHEHLRFEIDNGITLCKKCHRSKHKKGEDDGDL